MSIDYGSLGSASRSVSTLQRVQIVKVACPLIVRTWCPTQSKHCGGSGERARHRYTVRNFGNWKQSSTVLPLCPTKPRKGGHVPTHTYKAMQSNHVSPPRCQCSNKSCRLLRPLQAALCLVRFYEIRTDLKWKESEILTEFGRATAYPHRSAILISGERRCAKSFSRNASGEPREFEFRTWEDASGTVTALAERHVLRLMCAW